MSFCEPCCNPLCLGEFSHRDDKYTGIPIVNQGIYVIRLYFNGTRRDIEVTVMPGDTFVIPVSVPLNENYEYRMEIIDPLGEPVEWQGKTCFSFKTIIKKCANAICDINSY
jgi:hypothetical protein